MSSGLNYKGNDNFSHHTTKVSWTMTEPQGESIRSNNSLAVMEIYMEVQICWRCDPLSCPPSAR
ncbi:unnamed protein product [Prunus brigantina]